MPNKIGFFPSLNKWDPKWIHQLSNISLSWKLYITKNGNKYHSKVCGKCLNLPVLGRPGQYMQPPAKNKSRNFRKLLRCDGARGRISCYVYLSFPFCLFRNPFLLLKIVMYKAMASLLADMQSLGSTTTTTSVFQVF